MSARTMALDALKDILSGWIYIRQSHGELYGVGWDRAQEKATAAITALEADIAQAVEPVAYAIFAENGNIRVWTTAEQYVRRIAEEQGLSLVKLYIAPPEPAVNAELLEACRKAVCAVAFAAEHDSIYQAIYDDIDMAIAKATS